jgi:hypothetical protein
MENTENTENTKTSVLAGIVEWNKERGLLKKDVNIEMETSFIVEELLEMQTAMKSDEAREVAKDYAEDLASLAQGYQPTPHQVVDAACDIIVFATGIIAKMGYNPDLAMDEVLKEINSRVGGPDGTGKWVKDKSPEAQANWYTADFKKAKGK